MGSSLKQVGVNCMGRLLTELSLFYLKRVCLTVMSLRVEVIITPLKSCWLEI